MKSFLISSFRYPVSIILSLLIFFLDMSGLLRICYTTFTFSHTCTRFFPFPVLSIIVLVILAFGAKNIFFSKIHFFIKFLVLLLTLLIPLLPFIYLAYHRYENNYIKKYIDSNVELSDYNLIPITSDNGYIKEIDFYFSIIIKGRNIKDIAVSTYTFNSNFIKSNNNGISSFATCSLPLSEKFIEFKIYGATKRKADCKARFVFCNNSIEHISNKKSILLQPSIGVSWYRDYFGWGSTWDEVASNNGREVPSLVTKTLLIPEKSIDNVYHFADCSLASSYLESHKF